MNITRKGDFIQVDRTLIRISEIRFVAGYPPKEAGESYAISIHYGKKSAYFCHVPTELEMNDKLEQISEVMEGYISFLDPGLKTGEVFVDEVSDIEDNPMVQQFKASRPWQEVLKDDVIPLRSANYCTILKKYIQYIKSIEGTDYITDITEPHDFSDREWKELEKLSKETN